MNKKESKHRIQLLTILRALKLPLPKCDYRFHPTRKWEFDWCWEDRKIVLEVEGAVWVGGRHTNPIGFLKDIEKYNEAALMGYFVFRCTPDDIISGKIITLLERMLKK